MADVIGNSVLKISLDDAEARAGLAKLNVSSEQTAQHVKAIGQAIDVHIFEELGRLGFEAVHKIVEGVVELGERGAAVEDMAHSFDILSAAAGSTGEEMLGQLRQGVLGTLSDFDLMQVSNKALGSGLIHSAADMGTLAAGARALAKATGGTTKDAFDTLTSAMASGRTATLKQIGLFVDAKVATENWAAAHHKTTAEMTDADRAQALSAASLQALRERLQLIAPDSADFGEKIEQVKAKLANFTDGLAVAIAHSPVLAAGMDVAGKAISDAFGGDQQTAVRTVMDLIENLAISAVRGAGVIVEGARFIANAWSGLNVIFNEVASTITAALSGVVGGIASALEAASQVPGIGEKFKGAAATVREMADDLGNLSTGFHQNAESALDGAAKTNAAFDVAKKAIKDTADEMQLMVGTAREAAKDTGDALGKIGDGGELAKHRTAEAAAAIQQTLKKLQDDITLDSKEGIDKRIAQLAIERDDAITKARQTKDATIAEQDQLVALATQRYEERKAAAIAAGDEIGRREHQLQDDIALANMTGTQLVLAQIEIKKQAEIAGLEYLRLNYGQKYEEMRALVETFYAQQTAAARGSYASVELAAQAAGIKTRDQLEETLAKAIATYQMTLDKEKFTDGERQKAYEAMMKAQEDIDNKVHLNRTKLMDMLASSMSSVLRSIFGKSKAAAIAAAMIGPGAAVAKALSAYPWPWNLVPAAAALAAGMAQVNQIRNQNPQGFATGTPGLDFANFGSASISVLHGQEAVIPRGRGHVLAGEIATALPDRSNDDVVSALARMHSMMEELPRRIAKAHFQQQQTA